MAITVKPQEILEYWRSIGPEGWWKKEDEIDQEIISRFGETHAAAASGKLNDWQSEADASLALVIVLDQFSRNMFRGNAKTFAQDPMALSIAKQSVENGFDKTTSAPDLAVFFYLPYEHSESILDQWASLPLMIQTGDLQFVDAARWHLDIIKRFGRFPHRNKVLGRHTTPAEQAYLDDGGFQG